MIKRPVRSARARGTLGDVITLVCGQHVLAENVNEAGLGMPYLTGPSDFIGLVPVATKWTTHPGATCIPGDVLLTVKGSGCGSIAIADQKYAISRQLFALRTINKNDKYLRFLIPHLILNNNLLPSGAIPQFTRDEILNLPTFIHSDAERHIIGDTLSVWDSAIEALSGLITLKEKSLIFYRANLIHGEHLTGNNVESWPMVKLGEVTTQQTKRNRSRYGREQVMGVTKAEGIVPMKEHVIADDLARYLILPSQAFAYNPMRINIGSIAMSEFDKDVIVSPDYIVFACDQKRLLPDFLNHLRKTTAWSDFLNIVGNGSVRIRIYYDGLADFEFRLPPISEQRNIAAILNDAEREIAVLTAEKEALEKQRDALASEMLTGQLSVPKFSPPTANIS